MRRSIALVWAALVTSAAALDITYPKIGTTYTTTGLLDVQWQKTDDFDPVELAIYLATYTGQNLKSEQPCINATIDDDSTAITLSQPVPQGDSYTWMFYDNDLVISLGNNYVAQSIHFQFQNATPSASSTPSAKGSPASLSPAIAAAIGVGATLVLVAMVLLVGYCCFHRRSQRRKRDTIDAMPYTPGHRYSKQELDNKPGTAHGAPFSGHPNPPSRAEMKGSSQHELEVYPGSPSMASPAKYSAAPGAELSINARHSRLQQQHTESPVSPWTELAISPLRHEMSHDPQRDFRHELPGDMHMQNAQTKEYC